MAELRLFEHNRVFLVGRLTRDPELRFTPQGQAIANLSLALNHRYKDKKTGQWTEETSFIPIVVWGIQAERYGERMKRGEPIFVEGRLRSRSWEDAEGKKRTTMEVIALKIQFLKKPTAGGDAKSVAEEAADAGDSKGSGGAEEEIPF